MDQFTIELKRREHSGSAANRRYRASGLVPCVVYAHGQNSINAIVDAKEFIHLARAATTSQVFSLKSEDKVLNGRAALVKEIQRNYLNDDVLHIDFQALRDDEEVIVRVPLQIFGESVGVKLHGGILTIATHEIGVSCLPKRIPHEIKVDISGLGVGHSLHAKDLALPEGVKLIDDPEMTIASVVVPKVVEEAPVAVAAEAVPGAEGAEGGVAPAAEGAAKAEEPKKGEKGGK